MEAHRLRRLRRGLALLVVVYFFAGGASQKLIPGVDEILPFYGWSLFSKVPNEDNRYVLLVRRHEGRPLEPPVPFMQAPPEIVAGNRFIGRKVIQRLGRALDDGDAERVAEHRRLLEESYLRGRVRYQVVYERYEPLAKWRTGEDLERRSLGRFRSGEGR